MPSKRTTTALDAHLNVEEDAVIPLLLALSPEEFDRYYRSPLSLLIPDQAAEVVNEVRGSGRRSIDREAVKAARAPQLSQARLGAAHGRMRGVP